MTSRIFVPLSIQEMNHLHSDLYRPAEPHCRIFFEILYFIAHVWQPFALNGCQCYTMMQAPCLSSSLAPHFLYFLHQPILLFVKIFLFVNSFNTFSISATRLLIIFFCGDFSLSLWHVLKFKDSLFELIDAIGHFLPFGHPNYINPVSFLTTFIFDLAIGFAQCIIFIIF
jgi:hypothetical protein